MIEPMYREFQLITKCQDPAIDALAIMIELLRSLPPRAMRANLAYLNSRFETGVDAADSETPK